MSQPTQSELRTRIARLDTISTAPTILAPLLEVMRQSSDEIRVDTIVALVSRDGAIAAQCLRMANSPLFAHSSVETVRSAVMTLGIEKVRSLLFGVCMNQTLRREQWVMDRNAFWRHSLGCALVTQELAKRISYPEPEKAYLAGLVHDIGFLVNSVLCAATFRDCLNGAAAQRGPIHVLEERILGFTHAESGSLLCERWGFSSELTEAIRCHHRSDLLATANPLVCLVHLSDLLCRVRNLGYGYDEIMSVVLSQDLAWERLVSVYPELAEIDLVRFSLDIEGAMEQIAAVVDSVFAPPNGS